MDRANGIPLRTAIVPTRRTRRTRLVAHPHQNASYHDSVAPGTFIMLSVDLGQGFCSMSLEDSKALIEQLNGSLLHPYCGQFSVVSLVDAKLEGGCKMVTQAHDLPGFADYLRVQVFRRIKYLLDHAPAAVDVTVKGLPVELMQEIFSHLDTVKQKQLQRVCALWNRILVAPALRGTIVIRSNGLTTSVLGFMTVIRCLHPSTQRLILTSFEHGQCSTNYVMMFLGKVFFVASSRAGIRLRSIHLHRVRLNLLISRAVTGDGACVQHKSSRGDEDPESGYYWMQDFVFKCCRLPCDTLHIGPNALALMACDFHTDPFYRRIYRRKAEEFTIQVEIDIHATRLKPDGGFGCALWEAMEAALPVPSDGDVHDLFQRFRVGGDLRNNNKLKALLCTALCALQSADPRPSSHYHGKKWCVEGLEEVQLENLSRICRQLLIELRELMVERQW